MPTNFSYLLSTPAFASFAQAAVAAERIFAIDPATCALNCRKAMELAVKWMYSVDDGLEAYGDRLVDLIGSADFRDVVGADVWRRMDYVRLKGNDAAHATVAVTEEQAKLCLENLFIFLDFVAYCYGDELYTARSFDPSLLIKQEEAPKETINDIALEKLMEENKHLREKLTQKRIFKKKTYVPKPLSETEAETRKLYIDQMLSDAGWKEGKNWINEVETDGMPTPSGKGYIDYVLYDDMQRPLAIIEAKRTCVDIAKGRQQAKLYADCLEQKYGRRPVVFLSNGFDTTINDHKYPERRVSSIYSKRDLEKMFNLLSLRKSLETVTVDKNISGRWYQEGAVKAVCDAFDRKNRRKALLVMATGSGKTRTVISLCDVLLRHGWVKNILFLADRNSLVTQAKRSFVNLLPNLSVTNLCEEKDNYTAHCVFSTYQTMMNVIDEAKFEGEKLFTAGHFDLIICDEAHRSIYNKFRDIFTYFDAPLVGLTATPKDEIEKNTYEIFELSSGEPTYGYELKQAVNDGYLVDFQTVETKLKFIEEGIVYDDLTQEEKEEYENTFTGEDGEMPDSIGGSALNEWIFNEGTIREVLNILMNHGLRVDYGETLGKTIIFAKNHRHAEKIRDVFNKEYPHLTGYAKVIDNYMTYAQSAIDEFTDKAFPRIAISVDMLDTGIDIPSALNLVFFKKVMSKAKFWQMIGRGTRICKGLMDGKDKEKFLIFDFCGNFDFFRMHAEGKPNTNQLPLQGAIFSLKAQMAFKLQDLAYQTEELIAFRKQLVNDMLSKVSTLNKENFAVHQHLKYVEKFSSEESYQALTYEDTLLMEEELAGLIAPDEDEASAVRFDALMYGIELAYLAGKKYSRAKNDLVKKVTAISRVSNIPEIQAQAELIEKILHGSFLDNAGMNEFELIREKIRDLTKYIPHDTRTYDTNFTDHILSMEWKDSELDSDELNNYKAKAEYYVRQHQDEPAILKLKTNQPLTNDDIRRLEEVLWSEVGTKQDYENEYGEKPLGVFVREIVGMDMNAAKEAFSEYLGGAGLDARQIYFVNQIVEYIVRNGLMRDFSVLTEAPFTDRGSIIEVFDGNLGAWAGIRKVIEKINANAQIA